MAQPRFVQVGTYWINLDNIAFMDTMAFVPQGGDPYPAFRIVFNCSSGQHGPLELWLVGEDLRTAEEVLKTKWGERVTYAGDGKPNTADDISQN